MGKAPFAVNFYWLKVNDHLLLKALGGGDLRTRDQTKVDKIKQAVLDLTSQEGLLGWSIAKLAKRAGVSPATVYIYYPNQDEMLKELGEVYKKAKAFDTFIKYKQHVEKYNNSDCHELERVFQGVMEEYGEEK